MAASAIFEQRYLEDREEGVELTPTKYAKEYGVERTTIKQWMRRATGETAAEQTEAIRDAFLKVFIDDRNRGVIWSQSVYAERFDIGLNTVYRWAQDAYESGVIHEPL